MRHPTELRDHFALQVNYSIFLNWGGTNPATPSFHFTNEELLSETVASSVEPVLETPINNETSEQVSSKIESEDREYTPKLFSEDEQNSRSDQESKETEDQILFDKENDQDEDFEIPAFLRRQKF